MCGIRQIAGIFKHESKWFQDALRQVLRNQVYYDLKVPFLAAGIRVIGYLLVP